MLNLKQLETFVWIANLGSFRLAAEHLCTTQPAISTRISNLEQTFNTPLFNRDKGTITLTAKGRELLPLAENILSSATQLCYQANSASALSGLLRIGVSETIVHTWLPQFLASINETYPEVEIELTVDVTVSLSKELLAHNIDIAILLGPVSEPSVINQVICEYPLYWVASPSLGLKGVSSTEDFTQWPMITYARNSVPYHEIHRYLSKPTGKPVRFYSVSSLSASVKMVESGVGVATLPKEVIQQQLNDGQLSIIEAEWTPKPLTFTISHITTPDNLLIEKVVNLAFEIVDLKAAKNE
ncbi:LysR family transcriptional regulator [Photobacterium sp. GJ3]|uniref:LysR family transcriptional regulator n=1 Tax=Photobacterium sp. GJ3 TaxID=2829502 RepID=UPI001B8AD94F|nr:LysR family transcriptional regulator [Photobacterium sp. GJ3]QUJ66637.1 LysR family transcriptional regulator [Photobacterium sp. GJ3]